MVKTGRDLYVFLFSFYLTQSSVFIHCFTFSFFFHLTVVSGNHSMSVYGDPRSFLQQPGALVGQAMVYSTGLLGMNM